MYCRVYREDSTGVQLGQGEAYRFVRDCERMTTARQNALLEMADNFHTRPPADDVETLASEVARDEAANRGGDEDDDWLPADYMQDDEAEDGGDGDGDGDGDEYNEGGDDVEER